MDRLAAREDEERAEFERLASALGLVTDEPEKLVALAVPLRASIARFAEAREVHRRARTDLASEAKVREEQRAGMWAISHYLLISGESYKKQKTAAR